ncbi:unnamed protein product, partial [Phaeothamnion confervicola]
RNAATRADIRDVLIDRRKSFGYAHPYNMVILTEGKATNQENTGRCWLSAALNLMRLACIKKYKLPNDLELNKFKRANFALEAFMETCAEPLDGRLMQALLQDPIMDGGQWDMLINLVQKYGVVLKSAFPESYPSSCSLLLNNFLASKVGAATTDRLEAFSLPTLFHLGSAP